MQGREELLKMLSDIQSMALTLIDGWMDFMECFP